MRAEKQDIQKIERDNFVAVPNIVLIERDVDEKWFRMIPILGEYHDKIRIRGSNR